MKKLMILLVCTALCTINAVAQDDKKDKEKGDRIESYKIAFITEKLDLTPKEAAAFWPVYNEYNDQAKKLRAKEKERTKAYREKIAPTEQDAEKYIAEYMAYKQQEMDLQKRYMAEFKKVLPVAKVAKLINLEQEFKMKLIKTLKDKPHKG
jgi:Spy/CpxP family protein refolding chaperone